MKTNLRLERIISLVDNKGFLSVNELSQLCGVSEMTIRRDLDQLDAQQRIQRTYGGATTNRPSAGLPPVRPAPQQPHHFIQQHLLTWVTAHQRHAVARLAA